jgi:nitroimidazol reductase NimA-like FMN-containing flavoprotein (pyridoxamine 5'-phosphate oxidase superfamily)
MTVADTMTPEEIDGFLAEPHLCAFATVDEAGNARVRPLWYLWRDGEFWFTTRRESRHTGRDLETHPRVAVSVASEGRPYRAVVAHGSPRVVDPDLDMLLAISTRYGEAPGRRWTEIAIKEPDRVILRMRPDSLVSWDYGRSA